MIGARLLLVLWACGLASGAPLVTVVSGFWAIEHSKYRDSPYWCWLHSSMRVDAPYFVFYGTPEDLAIVKDARLGLETLTRQRSIEEFSVARVVPRAWATVSPDYSATISRDLSMIWLEKMAMVREVAQDNPFGSEWFAWADAGLNAYRHSPPPAVRWPERADALDAWPKDACVYAVVYDSGRRVAVSGSAFAMHARAVEPATRAFYAALDACVAGENSTRCGDDQAVMADAAAGPAFWQLNSKAPADPELSWVHVISSLYESTAIGERVQCWRHRLRGVIRETHRAWDQYTSVSTRY